CASPRLPRPHARLSDQPSRAEAAMTARVADMPLDEQPRERLARHGAETLSDAELVALVLSSGARGRNPLDTARTILADGLSSLGRRDWRTYARVTGVGEANAAKIAASFELGRRAVVRETPLGPPICDPEAVAGSLLVRYAHHVQEPLRARTLRHS